MAKTEKTIKVIDGNIYWPGGQISQINPAVVREKLREVRQMIADSKAGRKLATELGVKPKTIRLSDGADVPVAGSLGALSWLLGGTNPSAPAFRVARALKKAPAGAKLLREVPDNPSHTLFRSKVYHGGPVEDSNFAFYTTDPKYASQYGEVRPYLMETPGPSVAKEPLIGSRDVVTNDMFVDANTRGVGRPDAKAIIGHDLVTSDIPYQSRGLEVLSLDPKNVTPIAESANAIGFDEGLKAFSDNRRNLGKQPSFSAVTPTDSDVSVLLRRPYNVPGRVDLSSFPSVKYYFDEIYSPMAVDNALHNLNSGESHVLTGKHYNRVPVFNRESLPNNYSGVYNIPDRHYPEGMIELAPKKTPWRKATTMVHELSHAYRDALQRYGGLNYGNRYGLSDAELAGIDSHFGKYRKGFEAAFPQQNFLVELPALNTELRARLMHAYNDEYGKMPSRKALLDWTNSLDDNAILGRLENTSSYGHHFRNAAGADKQRDLANSFRWMLTTVPAAGAPLLLIPNEEETYASGGKIHIKPENRGKFTALKKRTGHSASWFKAHGTPAQKKMAVFELNARKWKHSDGGIIERLQSVYGDDIEAMREAIRLARNK